MDHSGLGRGILVKAAATVEEAGVKGGGDPMVRRIVGGGVSSFDEPIKQLLKVGG